MNRRQLTIICISGMGGPVLARTVSALTHSSDDLVKVISLASVVSTGIYCLDLYGVGPTFSQELLRERYVDQARRSANEIHWLLWEMNITASVQVSCASAVQALRFEIQSGENDAVILATDRRRLAAPLNGLLCGQNDAGTEVGVAIDRSPGRVSRYLTRLSESHSRPGDEAPRCRWHWSPSRCGGRVTDRSGS